MIEFWFELPWFNRSHYWDSIQNLSTVLPDRSKWFRAFETTPFQSVKAVILGQDPYPTPGHANGLAFSCDGPELPASLKNIFLEYTADLGYGRPSSGDLTPWAQRGVLLLNTALTVRAHDPGSHINLWHRLTDEVIAALSEREDIVWILWGNHAQQAVRRAAFDHRHLKIISSPHPSPLSAHRGFFGSRPFSRTNQLLTEPIDWRLP